MQSSIRKAWTFLMAHPAVFLAIVCGALLALWIPNLRYPLVSDPVMYAHLSRSIWEAGTYEILGIPHDVFPPMHPIVSYPFVATLGLNYGMKSASLVYGLLMAIALFVFLRRESKNDVVLAYAVTGLLAFSYTTTWLLSVGNADTLYGAEFFFALTLYLAAAKRPWLYAVIGVLLGMIMLTRYMGAALALIIAVDVLLTRRHHLREPAFWAMFPLAGGVFSLWILRNYLTFGTFMLWHVKAQIDDVTLFPWWHYVWFNFKFYINPVHSLALFAPLAIVGLVKAYRKHLLLAMAIPLSILPGVAYHTASSRYLIATIPLLLVFAVEGARVLRKVVPPSFMVGYLAVALLGNAGLTCLYSLPQCHAYANTMLPFLPREIGISQEAAQSLQEAVAWVNAHAEQGSTVTSSNIVAEDVAVWESSGRVRSDLHIALEPSCVTRTYDMDQSMRTPAKSTEVFVSPSRPFITVRVIEPKNCKEKP